MNICSVSILFTHEYVGPDLFSVGTLGKKIYEHTCSFLCNEEMNCVRFLTIIKFSFFLPIQLT